MRRAGLLNEKIKIYKVEWVKDDYGSQVETLQLRSETRARVIYNSGNRTVSNNEVVHDYYRTMVVRYYVEVEDYDVIYWDNKYYLVLSIDSSREFQEKTISLRLTEKEYNIE